MVHTMKYVTWNMTNSLRLIVCHVVDIYGGGFYNDTHLHKYTTEALTPFFDTLVDKS